MGENRSVDQTLTVKEVARILRVAPACVQRMCQDGRLAGAWKLDLGGRYEWRIPRVAVERRQLLPDAPPPANPQDVRRPITAEQRASLGTLAKWLPLE